MDRWCLLHLIEVLLITPCFCESPTLDCPDIKTTVGQPLNLTCTVTCEDCVSKQYKWMKDNKILKHANSSGQLQFYYPIPKFSMEHNGTYTFWVQLNTGPLKANFSVLSALHCPDINVTVGQPLNLTCTITCKDCNSTQYKWMKDNKTVKQGNSSGQHQFYYPIQNLSMEHKGTYTFWVQLNGGSLTKNFSILSEVAAAVQENEHHVSNGLHNHHISIIFVALLTTLALIVQHCVTEDGKRELEVIPSFQRELLDAVLKCRSESTRLKNFYTTTVDVPFTPHCPTLDCPDIKTTVGQPLNLTCTVTCEDCVSKQYKWKKDNKILKHANSTGQLQFYYPIPKFSMEHNGTYAFWVQLNGGSLTKNFSVLSALHCPDINATVGQSLNLTCTIMCKDCNSTKYKWKKDNKTLKHENSTGQFQFYYSIQNLSMEHNGTYTFWVQLNTGSHTANFSVILSENKNETNPRPDTSTQGQCETWSKRTSSGTPTRTLFGGGGGDVAPSDGPLCERKRIKLDATSAWKFLCFICLLTPSRLQS
ncbi:hypothetical protein MHYP_G00167070 [Metynnis hypsauchen]